ncbi:sulfotransferase [Moorena bouillonii]|uniref:sulfotransferase n=1 Tax=Moorena bouillonii TaxID=207920 RepID=UPI0013015035|nr:sulfotransferase [Moorena bouillonii]
MGNQLLRTNHVQEAEAVFQELSQRYPEKLQGYEGLARVAQQTQQWELAQQRWEKVLELSPNHIRALVSKGNTLIELRKYQAAEAVFEELSHQHPDQPQGYEGLARVAQQTKQWELALERWNIAISKTKAKSSYIGKCRLLVRFVEDEKAFNVIDTLIAEKGDDLEILLAKADLLMSALRFDEAVKLLIGLRNDHPENLKIKLLLSQALIGAKHFDEASRLIEELPNYQNFSQGIIKLLKTWQKNYQSGISFEQPKIFGIGLSKTGTTSLDKAFIILGYASLHFENPITKKVIDLEDILYYDAFSDASICFRFEELFFAFPNAKFIYTERNLKDWINSISNLFIYRGFSTPTGVKAWLNKREFSMIEKVRFNLIHRYAFESLYANHSTWEEVYTSFERRVNNFFQDKPPEKLLKLNICSGEGWEKLCKFLEVPVPSQPFPHLNKGPGNQSHLSLVL